MLTLAANGRMADAHKVIAAYFELMAAARGAVKVTIISAEPLTKKQLDTLQAGVAGMVAKGQTVDLTTQVEPSILGGLQVMVGDRFLDLSVSSRVASLSQALDSSA
ncbi:OSCP/delta subunit of ATPase [Ochromonadaceae sp. CCMP2298]|nr:OSCP/delta subunit of ATPase [Ochromonadaceae sp. CCMP2298]